MKTKGEILFIDDEKMVIKALTRQLHSWSEQSGIKLNYAYSVSEAMHILQQKKENIHVIVSDQRMPEITGTEFLKVIGKKYPTIVFIILSGTVRVNDMNTLLDADVFSYISKPWEKEQLITEIRKAMEVSTLRCREQELKRQLEEEILLAETFQKTFFLGELPRFNYADVVATYLPSSELKVSGDYLDVITLTENTAVFLLGDVSGHGLRPALMTVVIKTIIYNEFSRNPDFQTITPSELLEFLNLHCIELFKSFPELFLTFSVVCLDYKKKKICIASAGQPPVFIFRQDDSLWMEESSQLVLGVDPSARYKEQTLTISKGDIILMFSDGLYPTGNRDSGSVKDFINLLQGSKQELMNHEMLLELLQKQGFLDENSHEDDISALSILIK